MADAARRKAPTFSASRAEHALRFIETFCRHTKGRWAGQPIKLEPWQADGIVRPLFGEVDRYGRRRYREALIGLARKNGKSTLASAFALYLLFADGEPGAEIYSAAGDKPQARIVFGQARDMVLADPYLRGWARVYKDAIEVGETSSVYRVVSADAPLKHGLNVHGAIIDELHVHRDPELFYALRTGIGARTEPMIVSLTTAGYDQASLCYKRYQHGGRGRDRRFFHYWREPLKKGKAGRLEPDDEARLGDIKAWRAANPASWRQSVTAMREELASGLPEPVLRRLYLNQWTSSGQRWLPIERWDACKAAPKIPDDAPVTIGVDVAPKHDTTAVALDYLDPGGVHHVLVTVYEADPDTGMLDFDAVENKLREFGRRYDVGVIMYDPYNFTRSAMMLRDEGLPVQEFPQTNEQMVPASQTLFELVTEARLRHGGDPTLRAHADAAVARETSRGWRLDKLKAKKPIDAIVALAMAAAAAEGGASERSVYEDRGVERV